MTASDKLDAEGFIIVPQVLDPEACGVLRDLLGNADGAGTRGMLRIPEVLDLANSLLADLVRPHLPTQPVAVRGIYFDKRPETNWLVAWHQDLTLALRERVDVPGWGPWSIKDGVPNVQPPVELLEQMLTMRVHLDDADESNGALRVLAGTHRLGRLDAESIAKCRKTHGERICAAKAGDALLMRPLLLHASSRSTSERRRRVLHIEFAGYSLPERLEWHEGYNAGHG
jgi:Phytanoyl-CoA dioxygenase (PhyH)